MIDPSKITYEQIPYVIGLIFLKMDSIEKEQKNINSSIDDKLNEHTKILNEHTECLEIFKFSKCKLFPWFGRNKWIVSIIFFAISIWLSVINFSMDWITRAIQWNGKLP